MKASSMFELVGSFSIPLAGGLIAFLISVVSVGFLVATKDRHLHLSGDPTEGPQKLHMRPVPRIGGLGIALGVSTATVSLAAFTELVTAQILILIACTFPAFLAGFLDDITDKVPTLHRLLATMLAALAISILFNLKFTRVGIPGIDYLLTLPGVGTAAFVFCVAGVAQAFNIIDGQNGLSAGTAMISTGALLATAIFIGDPVTVVLSAILMGSLLGFLCYNYPRGRIFMGDGGAYLVGTLVAVLVIRFTETTIVSPWFGLVLVIYPVWETIFSIYRRIRNKAPIDAADSHHLHSLLFRLYNPDTCSAGKSISHYCWAGFLPFAMFAVLSPNYGPTLGAAALLFIVGYNMLHGKLVAQVGVAQTSGSRPALY